MAIEQSAFRERALHSVNGDIRRTAHTELQSELRLMETSLVAQLREVWKMQQREGFRPAYGIVARRERIVDFKGTPQTPTPPDTSFADFDRGVKRIQASFQPSSDLQANPYPNLSTRDDYLGPPYEALAQ